MTAKITTLTHKMVYSNPWMSVYEDEVELANGQRGIYGYLNRKPGVGALLYTADGFVLLERQWRYPTQDYSWEVPGGGVDDGEDLVVAVQREVEEEVGVRVPAEKFVKQITNYPLNSCSTETVMLFFAEVTHEQLDTAHIDDSEGEGLVELAVLPLDEAIAMIRREEILDANTAFSLLLLWNQLKSA